MKTKVLVIILFASAAMFSCGSKTKPAQSNKNVSFAQDSTLKKSPAQVSQVAGIGLIVPEDLVVDLSAEVGGTIIQIDKNISDKVIKGERIMQLDDRDEQLAFKKLQSERATQLQQITIAEAEIEDTKARLANEQSTLKSSTILQQQGAETKQNLDDLRTTVESLKAELKQRIATLELEKSTLNGIEIDIAQAQRNIEKKTVIAPSDGIILQIPVVNYSNVDPNEVVATFAPAGAMIARCEIDEMFANKVKIGQKAQIRYIGFDQVIATGKVVLMSPFLSQKSLLSESTTDQQDRRVREVRILLDNPKDLLFNSRVECIIQTN